MSKLVPPVPGTTEENPVDMVVLRPGDSGQAVRIIQNRLAALGFHRGLIDGVYGNITQGAVVAFQRANGLKVTGLIDNVTLRALGYEVDDSPSSPLPPATQGISVEAVARLFPGAPINNIHLYLPMVLRALGQFGLGDSQIVLMAIATIRVETGSFAPISEGQSRYNTAPGGAPFALYDFRRDLGNKGVGDGARFKGRGFIQLTGRNNYQVYSQKLGMGNLLIENPDLANDPVIASRLLAAFLKDKENVIRRALASGDLATARKAVNGGSHGLDQFRLTYERGSSMVGVA